MTALTSLWQINSSFRIIGQVSLYARYGGAAIWFDGLKVDNPALEI